MDDSDLEQFMTAEQIDRKSWHAGLLEDLENDSDVIDLKKHLTLLRPDLVVYNDDRLFVTKRSTQFLRAIAYYCAPTAYCELDGTFQRPACYVITCGIFRRTTYYIVQAPEITIIFETKEAS